MINRLFVIICFSLALILSGCKSERAVDLDAPYQAMSKRIDGYYSRLAEQSEFSGIIRVEDAGVLMFEHTYGYADWSQKSAITAQTRFGTGSVTKGITAALILELVKTETLNLDAKASKYVSELEPFDFTLRDILTHRAGLPRMLPPNTGVELQNNGVSKWIASHPDQLSDMGDYQYSNVGFAILAEIAENATGSSYEKLATQKLFLPLGLKNSLIDREGAASHPKGAQPYAPGPDPFGVMQRDTTVTELGSAGLVTSIEDLAKWGRIIGRGKYPEFLNENVRFGSVNVGDRHGTNYIWVQGSLPGYAAGTIYWPEKDLSISYVSNLFNHTLINIEPILIDLVLLEDAEQPPQRPDWVKKGEIHTKMTGRFNYPGFGEIEIKRDGTGSGLMLTMPARGSDWDFYLTPTENGLHFRAFNTIITPQDDGTLKAVQNLSGMEPRTFSITPIK